MARLGTDAKLVCVLDFCFGMWGALATLAAEHLGGLAGSGVFVWGQWGSGVPLLQAFHLKSSFLHVTE